MAGRQSRDKGLRFEREVVDWMNQYYDGPVPAKRVPLSGAQEGYLGDVNPGETCFETFHVECKRASKIGFIRWLEEAQRDAEVEYECKPPLVLCREDRGPKVAVLYAEDLKALLEDLEEAWLA